LKARESTSKSPAKPAVDARHKRLPLLADALRASDPAAVEGVLQQLLIRLRIPQVQLKLYRQLLTSNERRDYDAALQERTRPIPIDIWITPRRGISHKLAIVQLAFRAEILPVSDRDWLLRELGEELPMDWEIQHAVSLGGLVVVDNPRTVFWDSLRIRIDWSRRPKAWNLIWQLATKARRNTALLEKDAYPDDAVSDATLATAVSRLKAILPPMLADKILPGALPRSQRLRLDPSEILIFRNERSRRNVSG